MKKNCFFLYVDLIFNDFNLDFYTMFLNLSSHKLIKIIVTKILANVKIRPLACYFYGANRCCQRPNCSKRLPRPTADILPLRCYHSRRAFDTAPGTIEQAASKSTRSL